MALLAIWLVPQALFGAVLIALALYSRLTGRK